MAVRFLSPAWMDEVNAAAQACPELAASAGRPVVAIRQVVTDGPDGDVVYTLRVGDGRLTVTPGESPDAKITIGEDWPTAVALARGEIGADEAVMAGRIRVGGDMEALIAARDLIQMAAACLASVGRRSTY